MGENNSNSNNTKGTSDNDNYKLQINTTGKWRLDLTINGKYSSDESTGQKTIDVGDVETASVTVNQYEGGSTDVYLLDPNNNVVGEGSTSSEGVGTIYFYYSK